MLAMFFMFAVLDTIAAIAGAAVIISKIAEALNQRERFWWWCAAVFWFLSIMFATIAVASVWFAGK